MAIPLMLIVDGGDPNDVPADGYFHKRQMDRLRWACGYHLYQQRTGTS
jgi:hypothetical protein